MNMERIEITKCPNCGVTCKIGNDDDFQVFCACCRSSFKPSDDKTAVISAEEYSMMIRTAQQVYCLNAWEAFK